MSKEKVVEMGNVIRDILKKEFPESPLLEKQCKRASIMLDMACQEAGIFSFATAGHIVRPGDVKDRERGHVWNVVVIDDVEMLVDLTLTQFSDYLNQQIPEVVILPMDEAMNQYGYAPDGEGIYEYETGDVSFSLVYEMQKTLF